MFMQEMNMSSYWLQAGVISYTSLQVAIHDNVRENDIRYSDVDLHRVNNQIIGQGAWIDDAPVMIEVLYGDPNDPEIPGFCQKLRLG